MYYLRKGLGNLTFLLLFDQNSAILFKLYFHRPSRIYNRYKLTRMEVPRTAIKSG